MSDIDENEYDYYNEDEGDFDYEDQPEFMAERSAFERAGPSTDIVESLINSGTNKLEELNKKIFRLNLSKQEKFRIFMSVFFEKLEPYLDLRQTDLDKMLSISKRIEKIEYKNPIAFILGYYVCDDRTGDIKESSIENIINRKVLTKFDEVSMPDVIRYARLIKQFK